MQAVQTVRACRRCGLAHRLDPLAHGQEHRCTRCGATLAAHRWTSLNWAAAFAIAALVLFPASMLLPVLELEKLGHTRTVTVWSGAVDLMSDGQVLVGILVFACSIVVPILKMLGIVWLSFTRADGNAASRARLHALIDWVGRWSMLDVLLVAVLVAAIKLGNWADIHAGAGVLAFAAVVVLSLLASAVFDPHALWEGEQ